MYVFPRLARRFGAERLLVVGAIAFALRTGLSALATEPWQLLAIAPLEGVGFACVFVGGVTVLASRAPAGTGGTAQGILDERIRARDDPRFDARWGHRRRHRDPGPVRHLCGRVDRRGAIIVAASSGRPRPAPSTPAPVSSPG